MCFVPTFGGTNRAVSARFGMHELINKEALVGGTRRLGVGFSSLKKWLLHTATRAEVCEEMKAGAVF